MTSESFSAPFRIMDLPEELFLNIIVLSYGNRPPLLLHKRRKRERGHVYWRSGAPITYALVCKSWRRLIYSSPRLWASVTVNSNHLRIGDTAIRLFVNWLTRAKSHPLTIELNLEAETSLRYDGDHTLDILLAFVEMLYSKYVRKLSISLPPVHLDLVSRRLSAIFLDAPFLEVFSLKIPTSRPLRSASIAVNRPLVLLIDNGVPNLRAINIVSWTITAHVRNPQTSLTKLVLRYRILSLDDILETLQKTPLLEILDVKVDCKSHVKHLMINLAYLRELSVALHRASDALDNGTILTPDHFFLSIRAPSISKLVVGASHFGHHWGTILNFLSNSSRPPIVKFHLIRVHMEVWRLQFALSLMPKLETLELSGLAWMDGISKTLTIYRTPSSPCPPCPNLQELRIKILKGLEYDAEAFTFMIISRCRGYYAGSTVADGDDLSCLSPRSVVIINVGEHEKETLLNLICMEWAGCANYTCKAVGRTGNTLVIEKMPPRQQGSIDNSQ
ncbi:hypothetical protein SCHPADRAFT_532391 [Schizopora paradoxa]|uniref:F-box domain-containing protein n=1 Tax=Schizopora paradoxa TaxID=27342 RepID=A0A0H2RL50_9AGAM|nr:hypothetical protein SCHPADRAFT_532391 [Schizopora paradoxa]